MTKNNNPLNYTSILLPIKEPLQEVEQILIGKLQADIPLLKEVSHYILKAGGKRIRPALLLLASGAVGDINDKAGVCAAIIEYIHTATLLHDDVVDNADLRRSKKAARSIWGNEAAVLVGDYLFTISFQYLAEFKNTELVTLLSQATTAMAKGEIIQLERDNNNTSEAEYLEIIHNKTASLMGAAMIIGAKIAEGSDEQCKCLYDCGINIGMAFQMIDDALDYDLKEAKTGKNFGTDLKERKMTLPLSHLIENASQKDCLKVKEILDEEKITDSHVRIVHDLMQEYGSISYTIDRAEFYANAAKSSLGELTESSYLESIKQLTDFIVCRKV
jgi:octaprenyl-diphosphate synthase